MFRDRTSARTTPSEGLYEATGPLHKPGRLRVPGEATVTQNPTGVLAQGGVPFWGSGAAAPAGGP